jgi:hypothetical protein
LEAARIRGLDVISARFFDVGTLSEYFSRYWVIRRACSTKWAHGLAPTAGLLYK